MSQKIELIRLAAFIFHSLVEDALTLSLLFMAEGARKALRSNLGYTGHQLLQNEFVLKANSFASIVSTCDQPIKMCAICD